MSEELKKETDTPKKKVKKTTDDLTEVYIYKPQEGEELITDKSSEPLEVIEPVKREKLIVKSNKELYEFYVKDSKKFSLTLNGEVIYDSSIDKSKESPLKFEDDYFVLYSKKYSYNGLRIQKLNGK